LSFSDTHSPSSCRCCGVIKPYRSDFSFLSTSWSDPLALPYTIAASITDVKPAASQQEGYLLAAQSAASSIELQLASGRTRMRSARASSTRRTSSFRNVRLLQCRCAASLLKNRPSVAPGRYTSASSARMLSDDELFGCCSTCSTERASSRSSSCSSLSEPAAHAARPMILAHLQASADDGSELERTKCRVSSTANAAAEFALVTMGCIGVLLASALFQASLCCLLLSPSAKSARRAANATL